MPLGIPNGWWTLIAVLMGGGVTLLTTLLINRRQRRIERQRLRRALLTEITIIEGKLESIANRPDDIPLSMSLNDKDFTTIIYDSNISKLKILDSNEIEIVVRFYSLLKSMGDDIDADMNGHNTVGDVGDGRKDNFSELMCKFDLRNVIIALSLVETTFDRETSEFVYNYIMGENIEDEFDEWISKEYGDN